MGHLPENTNIMPLPEAATLFLRTREAGASTERRPPECPMSAGEHP